MILSGLEIQNRLGSDIIISPFNPSQLGPNSYNLRLHDELMVYENTVLDMKTDNPVDTFMIPDTGWLLVPGMLYLGRTAEYTRTTNLVPMIEGRSSIGRLGLYIHVTAGFGDVGFSGYWTLEISCIKPVRIYPYVEIAQIYYHTLLGDFVPYSSQKYQNNTGIQASRLYMDFQK